MLSTAGTATTSVTKGVGPVLGVGLLAASLVSGDGVDFSTTAGAGEGITLGVTGCPTAGLVEKSFVGLSIEVAFSLMRLRVAILIATLGGALTAEAVVVLGGAAITAVAEATDVSSVAAPTILRGVPAIFSAKSGATGGADLGTAELGTSWPQFRQ